MRSHQQFCQNLVAATNQTMPQLSRSGWIAYLPHAPTRPKIKIHIQFSEKKNTKKQTQHPNPKNKNSYRKAISILLPFNHTCLFIQFTFQKLLRIPPAKSHTNLFSKISETITSRVSDSCIIFNYRHYRTCWSNCDTRFSDLRTGRLMKP